VVFTVVGTALLIRALQAAVRYHALKQQEHAEVFS